MNKTVCQAGAVIALVLASAHLAWTQVRSITVTGIQADSFSQALEQAAAKLEDPSSNLVRWQFMPDYGWWGDCYGTAPENTFAVYTHSTRIAFFSLPKNTAVPACLGGLDALPAYATTTAANRLTIARPGLYTKSIRFSGQDWFIKSGNNIGRNLYPGPNKYCDTSPFVDPEGKLHLRIETNGCASEVFLKRPLGYGSYQFNIETPLSTLHQNAVLGLFTWSADAPSPHREIDIELSQWSGTTTTNAQFVVQPYTTAGNMLRFNAPTATGANTFSFDWAPGSVQFVGPGNTFEVAGAGVPVTGDEGVHLNLYWNRGVSGGVGQEIVISSFAFTPSARIGVAPATDLTLDAVASRGLRIPALKVALPEPWTFSGLPAQVRAARIGNTPAVDFTVMPNWSSQPRTFTGSAGSRRWTVNQFGAAGTTEQRVIAMLYYNLFGRVPSDEERDYQLVFALHQGVSTGELATRMFTSQEFQLTGHFVAGLYAGLLCRDPEYTGWLWQRDALQNGMQSARGMVDSFINSQEFQLRHGSGNSAMVTGLYRCALGRQPSPSELQFQLNALAAGLSRTDFALSVLSSPEFQLMTDRQVTAFLLYATLLNRDAGAAEKAGWINVLASTPLRNVIDGFINAPEFSLALQ